MKEEGGLEEEEEEEDVQQDVSHSRSMRHAFRSLSQSFHDSRKGFLFLFFIQCWHFTGSYGLKETTLWRPSI